MDFSWTEEQLKFKNAVIEFAQKELNKELTEAQLTNAELRDHFEHVISADEIRCFKPLPEVYQLAARWLSVEPGQMRLVAAHDWDVTGALRAGCAAAFVARPGQAVNLWPPARCERNRSERCCREDFGG